MKYLLLLPVLVCLYCCNTSSSDKGTDWDSLNKKPTHQLSPQEYTAIKFVDSFLSKNEDEIRKSTALKEQYKIILANKLLPLIATKGLYDDIPFKLVVTKIRDGVAYGNFIFDDDKHFIKVTCAINSKDLKILEEDKSYFIKLKNPKFQEGFLIDNSFTTIHFPVVFAHLRSVSN